ncbi:neprilysin-21-like isoform X2 [Ornithodoros turicata]|uniref:neprilysin-21-like isoform X2 n=1 Tax=Ornithodoros turicata TaxID=34597 RepID=UPI003138FCF0
MSRARVHRTQTTFTYCAMTPSVTWKPTTMRTSWTVASTLAKTIMGLKQFGAAYLKQDRNHIQQNRHHFGHQIVLFIENCVRDSAKGRHENASLASVLRYFNLEMWPYQKSIRSRQNVAHVAGKLAGSLALFPFLETRLHLSPGARPKVLLGQAELVLPVHELMDESKAMDWYRDLVTRAVRLVHGGKRFVGIVDGILEVERALSRAVEAVPNDNTLFQVRLSSLPVHRRWDWVTYMNGVLKGTSAVSGNEEVVVRSVSFLQRLSRLTRGFPVEALLNYLGYRLVLALSPLLPADFLVPLAVKGRRWHGSERVQSCVQLVENVFDRALTFVLQRTSPFLNDVDTKQKLRGLMSSLDNALIRLLSGSRWMTSQDKNVTLQKLANVSVSFLDAHESEQDLNQYFVEVPMLNERSLVESYFHMKVSVQRKYWNAFHKNMSYLMHHDISNLLPEYRYDPVSNALFLPYGVVGFLMHSKDVLPMHVPRFLPYAIRGLFSAVMTLKVAHDNGMSWSRKTALNFAHTSFCFLRQYSDVISNEIDHAVDTDVFLEDILRDNAVLEPLYRVYVNSFPAQRGKPAGFRLPTLTTLTSDELFFINYAIGYCEDVRNETMVRQLIFKEKIPARYKVNLPLSNYRRFAAVYKCKNGSRMNPVRSCNVW